MRWIIRFIYNGVAIVSFGYTIMAIILLLSGHEDKVDFKYAFLSALGIILTYSLYKTVYKREIEEEEEYNNRMN